MKYKEKAQEFLKKMTREEAIQLCDECLGDLGYKEGGAAMEEDDMYCVLQIENFLKIKQELL